MTRFYQKRPLASAAWNFKTKTAMTAARDECIDVYVRLPSLHQFSNFKLQSLVGWAFVAIYWNFDLQDDIAFSTIWDSSNNSTDLRNSMCANIIHRTFANTRTHHVWDTIPYSPQLYRKSINYECMQMLVELPNASKMYTLLVEQL